MKRVITYLYFLLLSLETFSQQIISYNIGNALVGDLMTANVGFSYLANNNTNSSILFAQKYTQVKQYTIQNKDFYVIVYPNPAKDYVIISLEGIETAVCFKIFDLLGNCALNEIFLPAKGQKITVPIEFLSPAVYTVQFFSNNQCFHTQKLIKTQ